MNGPKFYCAFVEKRLRVFSFQSHKVSLSQNSLGLAVSWLITKERENSPRWNLDP